MLSFKIKFKVLGVSSAQFIYRIFFPCRALGFAPSPPHQPITAPTSAIHTVSDGPKARSTTSSWARRRANVAASTRSLDSQATQTPRPPAARVVRTKMAPVPTNAPRIVAVTPGIVPPKRRRRLLQNNNNKNPLRKPRNHNPRSLPARLITQRGINRLTDLTRKSTPELFQSRVVFFFISFHFKIYWSRSGTSAPGTM